MSAVTVRYGYGDAGHPFDPDSSGRCRKRTNGYCDGTRGDSMHERREIVQPVTFVIPGEWTVGEAVEFAKRVKP